MSQLARDQLVANPKLTFTDDTRKSDLQNESLTNTYLIALLQWQLDHCAEPFEILAVRSDHPTPDGAWEHSGGCAADFYPSNWEGREEEAVTNVLKSLSENPYCEQVGLGGVTQQWVSYVTWPSPDFVFDDNDEDHIHASCATSINVAGGARIAGESY